jgi:hypothetical protein
VRTSILWSGFALFLGIGRTRCMRRLLDGLHGSNAVRPNGQVEHEDSLTSLQQSTPRFWLSGMKIVFVAMVLCAQPRLINRIILVTWMQNTSFEMRSWRRLK